MPEKSDAEKMKEYEEELVYHAESKASEKELEQMARHERLDDLVFSNFKERISHEPTQVRKEKWEIYNTHNELIVFEVFGG